MAAVVGTQNAASFAATLSSVLTAPPLTRAESDRSLEIVRAVVRRGGSMAMTASESMLVARHLLYSLKLTTK